MTREPTVLTFVQRFLPGFKGGGPGRTLVNLIDALGEEYLFRIVTSDRDAGDVGPYPGVAVNVWTTLGRSKVLYLGGRLRKRWVLWRVLADSGHDLVYLNSFFDPRFSILPLVLARCVVRRRVPIMIAPRGEFSTGALGLKRRKKSSYLWLVKRLGLTRGLLWQASSEYEALDIRRVIGPDVRVWVAPNIARAGKSKVQRSSKPPKSLRLVFLSRISPKKNLDGALEVLKRVRGNASFDIYGPIDDRRYWERCQELIEELPTGLLARYCGPVLPSDVPSVFANHDLFLFPTRGENYGHVIVEALAAGCPVLISDQTPWRGLEADGVGWNIDLADQDRFVEVIEQLIAMTPEKHANHAQRAQEYAATRVGSPDVVIRNRELFQQALTGEPPATG